MERAIRFAAVRLAKCMAFRGLLSSACMMLAVTAPALAVTPQLCSGRYHTLALRSDGQVLAWGSDAFGQLGQARLLFRFSPTAVGSLSGIRGVSSRHGGTVLALGNDGRVFVWGDNEYGEVGNGTRSYYGNNVVVANVSAITMVSSGGLHSMALAQGGTVWTWGDNSRGQLGDGTTNFRANPAPVPGLTNVVAISAGSGYSMALKSDGTVWSWGANHNGQVGNGTTSDALSPQQAVGLANITAISAGQFTSLALRSDGTVWGWGSNTQGQVGDGGTADRPTPVQAIGLSGMTAISEGDYHGAALRGDGTVWTWGLNEQGQLGMGAGDATLHLPAQVPGLSGVTALSAGAEYTLALKGGSIYAWGRNNWGELGLDNTHSFFVATPTLVPGMTSVTTVEAGFDVSFAISGGVVYGWGKNNYQQLASGPSQPDSQTTPLFVPGLSGAVAIACGRKSSYALLGDGSLWAWGSNSWGGIGDGTLVPRSVPVRVTGLPPVAAVSAAYSSYYEDSDVVHVLAVDRAGTVWAWGSNSAGQLGNGILTFTNGNIYYATTPVSLSTLPSIRAVAAGAYHSLALDQQGRIWAWGDNQGGELGDGTTSLRSTPVQISGPGGVTQIAAGWAFSMAITSDGAAWSWGDASGGQLGTGATTNQLAPARIPALSNVRAISAGADHAFAVLGDASLWAWGFNQYGAIGDGTLEEQDVPRQILGAGQVLSAVAGNQFSLASVPGGAALAWGNNGNGGLGDGTFAIRAVPQLVLGVNGTGFLNLSPESPLQVPADKVPPLTVVASGSTSSAAANVTATVQYRAGDVGSFGSVYVFAIAPANMVKNAVTDKTALVRMSARAKNGSKDAPVQCVLAQLNSTGQLQAVSTSSLQAYVTGVLGGQGQAVTVLNGVATAQIGGATFFVGYGSTGNGMFANGTNRSVATIQGTSVCQPQKPQTGWWWNPAEGGRGYSIEVAGNHIFFASYLYDVSGRATWYVASGNTSLDGSLFTGNLEAYSQGQTLTSGYRPPTPAALSGALTLAFNDASHGTMIWPGGSVPIERFNIVPNGLTLQAQANQPEGGWWFNPSEGGRGFFLEWQGGQLFMAGYMYDDAGNPIWYLSSNTSTNLQTYASTWQQYANGQTLTGAFKPAFQANANVGPVAIQFQGADTGIMTLPGGRTTAIKRFRF